MTFRGNADHSSSPDSYSTCHGRGLCLYPDWSFRGEGRAIPKEWKRVYLPELSGGDGAWLSQCPWKDFGNIRFPRTTYVVGNNASRIGFVWHRFSWLWTDLVTLDRVPRASKVNSQVKDTFKFQSRDRREHWLLCINISGLRFSETLVCVNDDCLCVDIGAIGSFLTFYWNITYHSFHPHRNIPNFGKFRNNASTEVLLNIMLATKTNYICSGWIFPFGCFGAYIWWEFIFKGVVKFSRFPLAREQTARPRDKKHQWQMGIYSQVKWVLEEKKTSTFCEENWPCVRANKISAKRAHPWEQHLDE